MYPNLKSLSDRENQIQELLRQIARDQKIENIKNEAYKNALWASDQADEYITFS
ncbi:TPA: hypothetical protein N0F65_002820 [Lagenidium giganteum]|uniref:Uncharacterized protein n=1 Tax=Lagenidium giganteum TaxID=4803 RepID=A0AAV2Z9I9_9STRA|nr:TPA: hypothetical protein N0F65_002820 [Lagenidium giganteum]